MRFGLVLLPFLTVAALTFAPGCSHSEPSEADGQAKGAAVGKLKIENPRLAWTIVGPARESRSYFPGEKFVLAFHVTNNGQPLAAKTKIQSRAECIDAAGAVIVSHALNCVLGDVWRGKANTVVGAMSIPETAAPGEYTIRWKVCDEAAGREAEVEEKIVVRPREFAIFNPVFKSDKASNSPAPLAGAVNGTLLGRVQVAEAERPKGKARIEFLVEVVDDAGDVLQALGPHSAILNEKEEHLAFALSLEAAGEFTLRLTAIDLEKSKTSILELPLTVADPFADSPRLAAKKTTQDAAK